MFKTIVVAVDGSSPSECALDYAVALAREDASRLVLAHVTELIAGRAAGTVHVDDTDLVQQLGERAEQISTDGLPGTALRVARTMNGGPAHAIAAIATEVNADLVVTGTRGHTALAGLVVGSVTQRLMHVAPCPVLVVPPPHES